MYQVIAFYKLYIKILFSEKVSFFYTLLLPILFAFVTVNSVGSSASNDEIITYISLFWSFIIMTVFINGIGIQLSTIRNYGTLKTYYAITRNKYGFLIGIVLVQLTISLLNLITYTTILSLYYGVFSLNLLLAACLTLILSIPFALLCMSIAALPIKNSNLTPLLNIIAYPLFIISFMETKINLINPFYMINQISSSLLNLNRNTNDSAILIAIIIAYIIFSIIIIRKFKVTSLSVR